MSTRTKLGADQPSLLQKPGVAPPESHYSRDRRNTLLREFVAHHSGNSSQPDAYAIDALDEPIDSTKATAIYDVHSYWSKKPHEAIRRYIRHYTKSGDLVLDPFCGSGGTGLAAALEGRATLLIDASPAACFIAAKSMGLFSCDDFRAALNKVITLVTPSIDKIFRISSSDVVRAVIYSERFRCTKCFKIFPFIQAEAGSERAFRGRSKPKEGCPHCGEPVQTNTDERCGFVPVEVHSAAEYTSQRLRRTRLVDWEDTQKRFPVKPLAIPTHLNVPFEGNIQPRLSKNLAKAGAYVVGDLFSEANLLALLSIQNGIQAITGVSREAIGLLQLALNAVLYNCTRMYRHRTHTAGGGGFSGTFYIPHLSKCINPWAAFLDKCSDMQRAITEAQSKAGGDEVQVLVSCESATVFADVHQLPDCCVDYVFTDPPYGGTYHYGALNLVWECWNGFDLKWRENEVIVSEDGKHTFEEWRSRLASAMKQVYRVLRPGRWVSLCFHGEAELWEAVADIMAEAGFVASQTDSAVFIDTGQKSYNQNTGATAKKRDLVINFRKPRPNEVSSGPDINGDEDAKVFGEKLRALISDFLSSNPGVTKDRIYDHVVSRMVRAGTMQAHNFEAELGQVAESVRENVKRNLFEDKDPDLFGSHEVVRWYLKSTQLDVVDSGESAKEDQAAEKLGGFIEKKVKASPWVDGVHYSDLFENYVYGVKEKPRRPMAEWLLDYFFKTESGTYRLPETDEEAKIKKEGRSKGTSRRIKRYLAFLEQGIAIPTAEQQNDSTLADWIRHAKRSGMYEAGKILFERGGLSLDRLTEEAAVNVEEDYQVCVRMLSRQEKG
jgi:16S rRNA G966 N2-methylase RsmD